MLSRRCRCALSVIAVACAALVVMPALGSQSRTEETIAAASVRAAGALDRLLPKRAETIYRALASRFRDAGAMEIVTYMDRYWRVAGNTGLQCLARPAEDRPRRGWIPGRPRQQRQCSRGWTSTRTAATAGNRCASEMTIVEAASGKAPEPVFHPVIDYIALCINSFSTPPDGLTARLVYVGKGTDAASYEGVDVKGAVVLGDGGMRALCGAGRGAARRGGRHLGGAVRAYTRPDETPEVFQWGGVPYDETAESLRLQGQPQGCRAVEGTARRGPGDGEGGRSRRVSTLVARALPGCRDSRPRGARPARGDGGARPGAGCERRCERMRDAAANLRARCRPRWRRGAAAARAAR